jgi:hypothetical protein
MEKPFVEGAVDKDIAQHDWRSKSGCPEVSSALVVACRKGALALVRRATTRRLQVLDTAFNHEVVLYVGRRSDSLLKHGQPVPRSLADLERDAEFQEVTRAYWRWQRATKRTLIFAVACVASVTILAVGAASSVIVSSLGGRLYADPLAGFEPAVDGVRALGRPNTEGGQKAAAAPTTVTPTLAVYASRGDSPSSVDFVPRWKPLPADTATSTSTLPLQTPSASTKTVAAVEPRGRSIESGPVPDAGGPRELPRSTPQQKLAVPQCIAVQWPRLCAPRLNLIPARLLSQWAGRPLAGPSSRVPDEDRLSAISPVPSGSARPAPGGVQRPTLAASVQRMRFGERGVLTLLAHGVVVLDSETQGQRLLKPGAAFEGGVILRVEPHSGRVVTDKGEYHFE